MKAVKLTLLFLLLGDLAFAAGEKPGNSNNLQAVLLTVLTVVLPVSVNYIIKIFESRNATNKITTEIDIHQKRIDFLNNYYTIQKNLITDEEAVVIKAQITEQLAVIKTDMDTIIAHMNNVRHKPITGKLTIYQSVFLLYPAKTFFGWVWKMLYYANFVILLFLFFAFFLDEKSNLSLQGLSDNLHDEGAISAAFIFLSIQFILHWLAISSYHRYLKRPIVTPG